MKILFGSSLETEAQRPGPASSGHPPASAVQVTCQLLQCHAHGSAIHARGEPPGTWPHRQGNSINDSVLAIGNRDGLIDQPPSVEHYLMDLDCADKHSARKRLCRNPGVKWGNEWQGLTPSRNRPDAGAAASVRHDNWPFSRKRLRLSLNTIRADAALQSSLVNSTLRLRFAPGITTPHQLQFAGSGLLRSVG